MEQKIKDAIISKERKVTALTVKDLSCNRMTYEESYKYLKRLNVKKFGICRFKE